MSGDVTASSCGRMLISVASCFFAAEHTAKSSDFHQWNFNLKRNISWFDVAYCSSCGQLQWFSASDTVVQTLLHSDLTGTSVLSSRVSVAVWQRLHPLLQFMRTVCIYQQMFVLHVSCWGFCSGATWACSHSYLSMRSSTLFSQWWPGPLPGRGTIEGTLLGTGRAT